MLSFVQEAGKIAQGLAKDSKPSLKSDRSVVTQADKRVSALARRHFKDILKSPEHVLVDEEDPRVGQYLDPRRLKGVKYIWALDPVDGTRSFADGMPAYGISIGIIRNLKPWMGVVYMPALEELFYCDGKMAYFLKRPFTAHEKKTVIKVQDKRIDHFSIVLMSELIFRDFEINFKGLHIMAPACGVIDFCWPAIGRGCAAILKASLWDFAGSWPVFQAAGLHLRSIKTGQALTHVDLKLFSRKNGSPWKLKEYYILSSKRNFPALKARLTVRGKK